MGQDNNRETIEELTSGEMTLCEAIGEIARLKELVEKMESCDWYLFNPDPIEVPPFPKVLVEEGYKAPEGMTVGAGGILQRYRNR